MKTNEKTTIKGKGVILVPYESYHVPRYHEWMQGTELQQLTASEPLSLDEEFEMQEAWRNDADKCTFIVLDEEKYQTSSQTKACEIGSMIGDVNLFFNDEDDKHSAEIELMIAEPLSRGKGKGKQSMYSMMKYGITALKVTVFTAKISYDNKPSLALFNKTGFTEVSRSDVFKEVTLKLNVTEEVVNMLNESLPNYELSEYMQR